VGELYGASHCTDETSRFVFRSRHQTSLKFITTDRMLVSLKSKDVRKCGDHLIKAPVGYRGRFSCQYDWIWLAYLEAITWHSCRYL
jgi:hypothetical protein